ncbi:MAG: arylsulfatase [Nevskia sp.]|nr:arylsulfatase [Nevskia sp.]
MKQAVRAHIRAAVTLLLLPSLLLQSACGKSTSVAGVGSAGKPNVLVILVDDLGYSDLSAFGSEISTPNIDQLAQQGRVLSNFHSTPLCATSRAELLTGADHHLVGVGTLPESNVFYPGDDDYKGSLNAQARTVAQLLRDAGYHTYMAGKWHLGGGGPVAQGFEQSFALDYSAAFASNYAVTASRAESAAHAYFENGVQAVIPDDFYSSDYFVGKLQRYIGQDHGDGKPFFAYLAFQAVHFPLQVPDAYLNLYSGRYDAGYDAIRAARMQKQKDLGLIPQDFKANPGDEALITRFGQPGVLTNQSWASLSANDKKSEARIMEVFAGMLSNLDDNVGKLVAYLKQIGAYDNTLIVFMSDNGADGMGYGFIPYVDGTGNTDIDNAYANYGKPGSFIFRSTRWAEVGTAPFRLFKGFTAEGGIGVPAIMRLPQQSGGAAPSAALSSLKDVVPTILAVSGQPDPGDQYQGHAVAPLEGSSLLPLLNGQRSSVHDDREVFADEVNDIRYVRRGSWKMTRVVNYLVPSAALLINHDWQLYQLDSDRGETTDVAAQNPDIVAQLTDEWRAYVTRVGVKQPILPPLLTPIDQ